MSTPTTTLADAKQRYDDAYRELERAWDEMNTKACCVAFAMRNGGNERNAYKFVVEFTEAEAEWKRQIDKHRRAGEAYRSAIDAD